MRLKHGFGHNAGDEIMHRMDTGKSGELMAAWLATGGAMDALDAEFGAKAGDDGLAASMRTGFQGGGCSADDGLQASAGTFRLPMCADDGLAAAAFSNRFPYCADRSEERRVG